ncbi:hydroxymethylglutaryl-CoA reductase, degradative [Lactobacillus corticis]|uniref:3-hydroxy-3-methylglutaryl coenzyme A reductase n=1 Tax=Lactobacillus corticis TaxID=2201249 RepID=A0A916QFA7_9LACO|nr:hydroxymethylglutaryl-CoA reductase, degradative [Lactobacillus corticis]GFZ26239.1 3-hydroxy-3-methylglutaryl-CoA reductase [Lactobacillus corticis]
MKFYRLSIDERRKLLAAQGYHLASVDQQLLEQVDKLSENVISRLTLPVGVITKLRVNGRDYLVPMAIEEPSVVAAANNGANMFNHHGGLTAKSQRKGIYGQIVLQVNSDFSLEKLRQQFPQLLDLANRQFASLVRHGGGVKKITARQEKQLVYLLVLVDPAEAMGANKTNAILEYLGQQLDQESGVEDKLFAILSNYPSQFVKVKGSVSAEAVGGEAAAKRIALLSQIGHDDVYRAVTNNKGIMNGVDACLLALGQDWRAVENAVAVWANQSGQYRSLSKWYYENGELTGELTLPLAIGTVGGSIKARSDVSENFQLLGQVSAKQLAEIIASVGLANNLAALKAISTDGIQAGHMRLQARNLVASLDASEAEKKAVLADLRQKQTYTQEAAQASLRRLRMNKKK